MRLKAGFELTLTVTLNDSNYYLMTLCSFLSIFLVCLHLDITLYLSNTFEGFNGL